MDQMENTNHPFIVRIWIEETAGEAGQATWRGHITHVPTGKRHYVGKLDDIPDFIAPYLERMGVCVGIRHRLRRWLRRLKDHRFSGENGTE
jgi:hypothetical protein